MTFRRLLATLALAACIAVGAFATTASADPFTDNFVDAGALDISGTRGMTTADLSGATREAGEPTVAGSNTAHTVWWRYVPTQSGFAKFSTCKPTGSNPVPGLSLGVYTGSQVDSLTSVAQGTNNCPSGFDNAQVGPFPVSAGNYYWLQIGGATALNVDETDLNLTLDFNSALPVNDDWASATTISGALPQTFSANNGLATIESNEPYSDATNERQSLWWKWTATASGVIAVDTCGSTVESGQDSVLTVFEGNVTTPTGFSDLNSLTDQDGGCSASNYNLSKAFAPVTSGNKYWIKLSNYSKDWGFPYSLQVKWVTTPDYADPPSISSGSSTLKVGNTAFGNDANWAMADTITNRWRRCDAAGASCVDISGATGMNYVTTVADVGHTLRFRQTATNTNGSSFAESDPSGLVDDTPANNNWASATNLGTGSNIDLADDNNFAGTEVGEPVVGAGGTYNTVWYKWTPSVSGNYTINNCLGTSPPDYLDLTLGVYTGSGAITSLTSAGNNDNGCGPKRPSRSSMLFNAVAGTTYSIQVGSRLAGFTGSFRLQIYPVGNPVVTVQPTLSGTAAVTNDLTLDMGDWISPTSISPVIKWWKCDGSGNNCVDTGLAGNIFSIPLSYGGSTVKATVELTNPYGTVTSSVTSALIPADADGDGINDSTDTCPTEAGNKPNGCPASDIVGTGVPSVSGNYVVGQTLTSTAGTWNVLHDPLGYTVAYQWQRCTSTSTATCTNIAGATASTYVLAAGDLSRYVRVIATATNADDTEVQNSTVGGPVASPPSPPANTVAPTVSGTPIVGLTLTSTDGTWTPAGVTFTYRWLRCTDNSSLASCTAISGATASTYTMASADLGRYMRVEVTGTNIVSSAVANSSATAVVTGDSDGDGVADVYDTCPSEAGTKPNGCLPSVINATGAPVVSGTNNVGQTLSSTLGDWTVSHDPLGYTVAFQWQRCDTTSSATCADISGANSDVYVLQQADYGKHMRIQATASNADDAKTQSSAIGAAVGQTPGALASPVVSGTTMEGETLGSTDGIWVPFDTVFTYGWLRCTDNISVASCTPIASATVSSYTLTAADIGSYIRSRVTGTNSTGSDSAESSATAIITIDTDADNDGVDDVDDACPSEYGTKPNGCLPSVLVPAVAPTISTAAPEVGVNVFSTDGSWTVLHDQLGYTLSYQWQRCTSTDTGTCADIPGMDGSAYIADVTDYKKYLRIRVTATNADDTDTQYSAVSARVEQAPVLQSNALISGTAIEGATLTLTSSDWAPADATVTHEWLTCTNASPASCTPISGATGNTYTITNADVGMRIRVRDTATTPAGSAQTTSSAVGPVAADGDGDSVADGNDACPTEFGTKPNGCLPSVVVADSLPTLSGTFNVGQSVSTSDGGWHVDHDQLALSFAYQWQRCTAASAGTCSDIGGATSSSYTLVPGDYHRFLRAKVTASNADDSKSQFSGFSAEVSQDPANTGAPSISGTAITGGVLTADQGTWTPADAALANQWLICDDGALGSCADIAGQTGPAYVLTAGDAGKYVRVRVTATTSASSISATSAAFGPSLPDADGDGVADGSDACPLEAGTKPNGCLPSVVVADSLPTLSGTFTVGQSVSTSNGGWHVDHDQLALSYAFQWQRCTAASAGTCSDIGGATSSSYTLVAGDYHRFIRAKVTASNADDSKAQFTGFSAEVSQTPVNNTAPSVTGTTTVGQTLSGNQGTWTPGDATLTNSWLRCDDATLGSCSAIGASGSTYTLQAADEGKRIRLRVSGATTAGNVDADSAATAAVIVDSDGDGVADGSDACPLEPGTKPNGCLPSDVSGASAPTLSGTFEVGNPITTDDGAWQVLHDQLALSFAYQWQRCTSTSAASCSNIPGATSSSLNLTSSDYGNYVRASVTASNADDSDVQFSAISAQIWQRPSNLTPPSVSGISGVGDVQTAHQGTWTPAAATLATEWLRCDDDTSTASCSVIPGQTGPTYTTTASDLHKFVRIRVTATTPIDTAVEISAASAEVVSDSDGDGVDDVDDSCPAEAGIKLNGCLPSVIQPDAAPVISGDLTVGEALSTTDGDWTVLHDQLGYSVSYQWQSCDTANPLSCNDLLGHTSNSYTLGSSEYGKYMRVVVTASNADSVAIQSSAITAKVDVLPTYSSPPAITGAARVSVELAGNQGTWDPADTTFTYQWLRCSDNVTVLSCSAIGGETGTYYTLQPADDGQYLRFRVTAQTTSGTATVESAPTDQVYTDTDNDGVHDIDDACPTDPGDGRANGCPPSDITNTAIPTISGNLVIGDTLSTDGGSWGVGGDQLGYSLSYQWQFCPDSTPANCIDIGGTDSDTYSPVHGMFGKGMRVVVTASNADDSVVAASAITGALDEAPYFDTQPYTNGVYEVGQTLSSYDGDYGPGNVSVDRVWLRCDDAMQVSCSQISGATSASYTIAAADYGKYLVYRVHIANGVSDAFGFSSVSPQIGAGTLDTDGDGVLDADDTCPSDFGDGRADGCPPSTITPGAQPTISGTIKVGQSISVVDGGWIVGGDPLPLTHDYAWDFCSTSNPITCGASGQTTSSITLTSAEYGKYLRVHESVSNADDSNSAVSTIVGPVEQDPVATVDPALSGSTVEGQTLTTTDGTWDPADTTFDYAWLRCDDATFGSCSPIPGETAASYALDAADVGKRIRSVVTGTTSASSLAAHSAPSAVITAAPVDTDGDGIFDGVDTCPADAGDGRPNGCPPSVLVSDTLPAVTGGTEVGDVVTGVDGTWHTTGDPLGFALSRAWLRCDTTALASCSSIGGESGASYTLTAGDYGKYIRFVETAANADDSDKQNSAVHGPVTQAPSNSVAPSISGVAMVGEVLTAQQGTWSPFDVSLSNQWLLCTTTSLGSCNPISGATGATYTIDPADESHYIRLQVTGTTTSALIVNSAPTNLVAADANTDTDSDGVPDVSDACPTEYGTKPNGCLPSVLQPNIAPVASGTAKVGASVSATDGTWKVLHDPLGYSISYRWQRCDSASAATCSDIGGAISSGYTPVAGDYGKYLRMLETASNADDSDQQGSNFLGPVTQDPANTTLPSISGTTTVGNTLTAGQGTWTPADATLTNAWLRCDDTTFGSCSPISGETGSTYVLAGADLGKYIRVEVSGATSASTVLAHSAATAQISAPGVDSDGDGVLDGSDACPAEAGTKPNGCLPSVLVSNALPSISGTTTVGQSLSGTTGSWNVLHDQLGYSTSRQWQRCDTTSAASCSDVSGQTGATYALTTADYGKYVRLVVTASNADDSDVQASAITAQIGQAPANTVAPSLTGGTQVGDTLTASQGTWTPADATLTNAWMRCDDATLGSCSAIGGQTGSTYTLVGADTGKYIRVSVSGTTSVSTLVANSAPAGPVTVAPPADGDGDGVPDSSDACPAEAGTKPNGCLPSDIVGAGAPTISGTLQTLAVLSSTTGSWTVLHDQLGYTTSRQWQRCDDMTTASCSDIGGETGANYTVTSADIGKHLRIVVTATNADDTELQASAITPTAVVPAPAPVNTVLPDVAGSAQVGQLLSTSGGDWNPIDTVLTYEWLRCDDSTLATCSVISGAASGGYQVASTDLGKLIRVRVTGTANAQTAVAVSNPTSAVTAAPVTTPPVTTPPGSTGNPAQILGPQKKKTITVRMNKRGQIYISKVSVYCMMESTGDCSGNVSLKARISGRTRSIGGFKLSTKRGGGRTLRIKLTGSAQKYIRAHGLLKSSLKVTYKSPGIGASVYNATVKIKR